MSKKRKPITDEKFSHPLEIGDETVCPWNTSPKSTINGIGIGRELSEFYDRGGLDGGDILLQQSPEGLIFGTDCGLGYYDCTGRGYPKEEDGIKRSTNLSKEDKCQNTEQSVNYVNRFMLNTNEI